MMRKIVAIFILGIIILGLSAEVYRAQARTIVVILPSQVTVKNWKEIYPAD